MRTFRNEQIFTGSKPSALVQDKGTGSYEVQMGIATARIELMGELTVGLVVFANAEAEPLLGVTALESVGVEVDPRNQRLTKLSAVRLKAALPGLPLASAQAATA